MMKSLTPVILAAAVSFPGCSLVYSYPGADQAEAGELCQDEQDNDYDGALDCADAGCAEACDESKHCFDGRDNDLDGESDRDDADCHSAYRVEESGEDACSDGKDQDYDTLVDCADEDCEGFCPESSEADCTDDRDNDGDELIDAADVGCWPFMGMPNVTRCASREPVDWVETFDGDPARGFTLFGTAGAEWKRGTREDLAFSGPASPESAASATSDIAFPDTEELTLSFDVAVLAGTELRVLLVPADELDDATPPRGELEFASLALRIHADGVSEPQLELRAGGDQTAPSPLGDARRITLSLERGIARAKLADQVVAELEAPSLPPFRLVVWSFGVDVNTAFLDDVELSIPGRMPCGRREPQLFAAKEGECPSLAPSAEYELGHALAAAAGSDSTACALVLSSQRSSGAAGPVKVFRSEDRGVTWASRGSDIPSRGEVTGVGVTFADDRWRAIIGLRDGALSVLDSPDCTHFAEVFSLTVPAAESPSIIFDGVDTFVYYLEASDTGGQNLKRRRITDQSAADEELVASVGEDLGVIHPATLSRIGGELVLVYPDAAERGPSLRAAITSADSPGEWAQLPAFVTPPNVERSFDTSRILAGTLLWTGDEGVVLYGGLGFPFGAVSSVANGVMSSVGAAQVGFGDPAPELVIPVSRCGDGACDSSENCADCPTDCCVGPGIDRLLADPSSISLPDGNRYLSDALNRAVLTDGEISRALSLPTNSRFDLSFKLELAPVWDYGASETTLIGVVSEHRDDGVFVRTTKDELGCTPGRAALGLLARSGMAQLTAIDSDDGPEWACSGHTIPFSIASPVFAWLRREGGAVTLTATDGFGCNLTPAGSELRVSVPSGLSSATALVARSDLTSVVPVYVSNVVLDTAACQEPGACPACGQLDSDPEHCGACGTSCGSLQFCLEGECTCAPAVKLKCGSECTDSRIDPLNCGACGRECPAGEACLEDECGGSSCASPLVVPSETESLTLAFDRALPVASACTVPSEMPMLLLKWTAPRTASVRIEATAGALVSVHEDCAVEFPCNNVVEAVEGATYFIRVFNGSSLAELQFVPLS